MSSCLSVKNNFQAVIDECQCRTSADVSYPKYLNHSTNPLRKDSFAGERFIHLILYYSLIEWTNTNAGASRINYGIPAVSSKGSKSDSGS